MEHQRDRVQVLARHFADPGLAASSLVTMQATLANHALLQGQASHQR